MARCKLSLPADSRPGSLLAFEYNNDQYAGRIYHGVLLLVGQAIDVVFFYSDAPAELITIDLDTGKDSNRDTVRRILPGDPQEILSDLQEKERKRKRKEEKYVAPWMRIVSGGQFESNRRRH